ncbi:hypothetical protein [Bradyrhizobium liaoningense]
MNSIAIISLAGFNQPLVTLANCASMATSLAMASRFLKKVAYWLWWAASMNCDSSSFPQPGGFSAPADGGCLDAVDDGIPGPRFGGDQYSRSQM